MKIRFKRMKPTAEPPARASIGAAGFDLKACSERTITVVPGVTMTVPTGISLEIPEGYEGQVRSRSGFSRQGITVANSPGTIDSDYRGEIKVLLVNRSDHPFFIRHGDRIAQIVIQEVPAVEFVEAEELGSTERGDGGFGSTGI